MRVCSFRHRFPEHIEKRFIVVYQSHAFPLRFSRVNIDRASVHNSIQIHTSSFQQLLFNYYLRSGISSFKPKSNAQDAAC